MPYQLSENACSYLLAVSIVRLPHQRDQLRSSPRSGCQLLLALGAVSHQHAEGQQAPHSHFSADCSAQQRGQRWDPTLRPQTRAWQHVGRNWFVRRASLLLPAQYNSLYGTSYNYGSV